MTPIRSPRSRTHLAAGAALVALVGLGPTGCGAGVTTGARVDAGPTAEERNLVPAEHDGPFRFSGTVLEDTTHGPQLCTSLAESLPPQCGGPDVVGFEWDGVDAESAAGTTWADVRVVGTWDEATSTLTATSPAAPRAALDGAAADAADAAFQAGLDSPCPVPEGGWAVGDPALATSDAQSAAFDVARRSPDVAGTWVDQLGPRTTDEVPFDPAAAVVNASTTGDAAALEAAMRGVWSGPLCVSAAERSEAELRAVQEALDETPGFAGSGPDPIGGTVELTVWRATEELQRSLDAEHGDGVVVLRGVLEPLDP